MYKENKGYKYEEIAIKYLVGNNFKILEQNFTSKFGEIDIIASKEGVLTFIEVKGRKNLEHGYPREAVTNYKQKRIVKAAKYYLLKLGYDDIPCKFDVIEIILDEKKINHLENAFC